MNFGEPGGNRTPNPQIKSLLLCQLSYRPAKSLIVSQEYRGEVCCQRLHAVTEATRLYDPRAFFVADSELTSEILGLDRDGDPGKAPTLLRGARPIQCSASWIAPIYTLHPSGDRKGRVPDASLVDNDRRVSADAIARTRCLTPAN